MEVMGSKTSAARQRRCGVPVVPGTTGSLQSYAAAAPAPNWLSGDAESAAGGGGKGIDRSRRNKYPAFETAQSKPVAFEIDIYLEKSSTTRISRFQSF